MKYAVFGDVHGNLTALKTLYEMLRVESVDKIYHLSDLIDRGEDPGGVISFCMEHKIYGPKGNHESSLLEKHLLKKIPPKNQDKLKSYNAILEIDGAVDYLNSLPNIIIIEEAKSILVHAGIDPLKSLANQNSLCCYIGMVNEQHPGSSRWFNTDRRGIAESENRLNGWFRWYEKYNFDYDVYHGHMVHKDPNVMSFPMIQHRKKYALDTGAWYTGMLSAAIFNENGFIKFISTPRLREPNIYEEKFKTSF